MEGRGGGEGLKGRDAGGAGEGIGRAAVEVTPGPVASGVGSVDEAPEPVSLAAGSAVGIE